MFLFLFSTTYILSYLNRRPTNLSLCYCHQILFRIFIHFTNFMYVYAMPRAIASKEENICWIKIWKTTQQATLYYEWIVYMYGKVCEVIYYCEKVPRINWNILLFVRLKIIFNPVCNERGQLSYTMKINILFYFKCCFSRVQLLFIIILG